MTNMELLKDEEIKSMIDRVNELKNKTGLTEEEIKSNKFAAFINLVIVGLDSTAKEIQTKVSV